MKAFWIIPAALLTFACSTKAPEDPGKESPPKRPKIVGSPGQGPGYSVRQLANELGAYSATEVKFSKGESALDESARKKILSDLRRARKKGDLSQVTLVSWGDRGLPDKGKDASAGEKKLAEERLVNLARFLVSEEPELAIERVSMASRTGGIREIFSPEAARIQESLERAGAEDRGARAIVIFGTE